MLNEESHLDQEDIDVLPPGVTLLRGQYMIESYLVRGGFGVTYLARDSLERQVVIKECFPAAISCRVGEEVRALKPEQSRQYNSILRHFLREARRLARLDHPNIVGVHQVFEENNTAYMALDYVEGDDLLTVAELTPDRLTPALIRRSLETALHSVDYIHSEGILHRDISPDNFLMGPNDDLTLIDFGAAREQAGRESRALSALLAVKDGYSPHEFYMADVSQFACSDLYSLGATFYHLITGEAPPHSQDRLAALAANSDDPYCPLMDRAPGYDRAFLATIDKSLSVLPKDRMQTAEEWLAALHGEDLARASEMTMVLGSDLRREISRLVEDTNSGLVPGKPGDAKRARYSTRAPDKLREQAHHIPRQPVDIFGNPIDDIEAWLQDQDTRSQARANAGRLAEDNPEPEISSDDSRRPGLFARSLTALRIARSTAV
ncbi:MAG: serine/threonine protein kinase [Paracoccaceae bacterium]